jgi:hypothetical protein
MAVAVAARRATLLVLIFLVSAAGASGEVLENYAFFFLSLPAMLPCGLMHRSRIGNAYI